jgi:hypothetical protein
MSTPINANDFLMGGAGAPSAKFPTVGTSHGGRITEQPTVEQQRDFQTGNPKFWDDGNPMMQLVVTIQTDERDPSVENDNGRRRIFVKGQLKTAIQEAVRSAGARGLEVGGHLTVTYTHNGEVKKAGFNPPKLFTAVYVPAANAEMSTPAQEPPAGVNPQTGEITGSAPSQPDLNDPAVRALLAQMQAQQAAPVQTASSSAPPPF